MTDKDKRQELITAIGRKLADDGLLIEAGFAMFAHMCMPPDCGDAQKNDMRIAFFAGAQHVYGTMMNIMDPGEEPTNADLRRMELIDRELNQFGEFMASELARRGTSTQ